MLLWLAQHDQKCAWLETYLHMGTFGALTIAKSSWRFMVQSCRTVEKIMFSVTMNVFITPFSRDTRRISAKHDFGLHFALVLLPEEHVAVL